MERQASKRERGGERKDRRKEREKGREAGVAGRETDKG